MVCLEHSGKFKYLIARNIAEIWRAGTFHTTLNAVSTYQHAIFPEQVSHTYLDMHAFPRTRALLCIVRLMNINDCYIESCVCISSCEPCHNTVYALGNIDICPHVVEDIAIIIGGVGWDVANINH